MNIGTLYLAAKRRAVPSPPFVHFIVEVERKKAGVALRVGQYYVCALWPLRKADLSSKGRKR